jgi:hypothetical protein
MNAMLLFFGRELKVCKGMIAYSSMTFASGLMKIHCRDGTDLKWASTRVDTVSLVQSSFNVVIGSV